MNEVQKAQQPQQPALTIQQLLKSEAAKKQIAAALPTHVSADRMLRSALTMVNKNPLLAKCDQASFFGALLTLSQIGLEYDGRRAHLIPFYNNKKQRYEVQLIIDYKGLLELALNSGKVSSAQAFTVCENDVFVWNKGVITTHNIDWRKPRGEVYAVYSLAKMKDGTETCEVMTRDEIEAVRARSKSSQDGPWVTDWSEMAKKTVFRRHCKMLPQSAELRDALDRDDDSERGTITAVASSGGGYEVSVEVPSDPPRAAEQLSVGQDSADPVQPAPAQESASPPQSAKAVILEKMTQNKVTVDDLRSALRKLGAKWHPAPDTIKSLDDLTADQQVVILNGWRGIMMVINDQKGGAK